MENEYSLSGFFTVVEDSGPKPYDMTSTGGPKGVSHKVMLRPDSGADREVKCLDNVSLTSYLGKKVEVAFVLLKGGYVQVVGVLK